MSFKKIELIKPEDIGRPESGYAYFGRDSQGYWDKIDSGEITRLGIEGSFGLGAGSSGTSGKDGVDGEFLGSSGTSGNDGSSGVNGAHGSSGRTGTHGTSGLSGINGTSGTGGLSGTSGTSGSSGLSGTSGTSGLTGSSGTSSNGSSGTSSNGSSGTSGIDGSYGAATRLWLFTNDEGTAYVDSYFYTSGSTDLSIVNGIIINVIDYDNSSLDNWINTWNNGLLKIEKFGNPSIFGIYNGILSTQIGNTYHLTNLTTLNGYSGLDGLIEGDKYLISFIKSGDGSGLSGSSGTSGSGSPGTSGTSGVSQFNMEWTSFEFRDLDTVTGQTYILDLLAFTGYTINSMVLQGDTGTGQTTAYINDVSIGGLANVSFNSTITTYNATSTNIVEENDLVKLIITSLAGDPTLIRGKLKITR